MHKRIQSNEVAKITTGARTVEHSSQIELPREQISLEVDHQRRKN